MSYHKTNPTVYAVMFDERKTIKIGCSSVQRWRNFRGAALLQLIEFTNAIDAYYLEAKLHTAFRSQFPPAFASAAEANPFLLNRGGGWMECYLVEDESKARSLFESIVGVANG
jgi:hypothetical protein